MAAQTTTDYDQDNDGLIEVKNLEQLNAIRWDLDGDGAADDPTASSDPDDPDAPTQGDAYANAFSNPADNMGCPSTGCVGYELTADLDFDTNGSNDADASDTYWNGGLGWDPIGYYLSATDNSAFTATFDGNGDDDTIANLYINRPAASGVGLFGYVGAGAEIRKVGLLDVDVTGRKHVGGLVGRNEGAITDSHATGTVTDTDTTSLDIGGLVGWNAGTISASSSTATVSGDDRIGGLVGKNEGGTISASQASGAVSGLGDVGGLVGWNSNGSAITDSHASGAVTVTVGSGGGGLVGANAGTISASYATGTVSGADSAYSIGGLVGRNTETGTISASKASGVVSGQQQIGGLVGQNEGEISASYATGRVTVSEDSGGFIEDTGGLVGANDGGTIHASYATGMVSGADRVGGLVGWNPGTISASYATGAVMGSENSIGGLVGWNDYGGKVLASYATGAVMGSENSQYIGGLVGESSGTATVSASYWDTETSGQQVGIGSDDADDNGAIDGSETAQDGATGKTTSELKTPTDYTDLDPDTEDIYAAWNLDLDDDATTGDVNGKDDPWDFGTASQYPVLQVDFTGDGTIDADDIDPQRSSPQPPSPPQPPPRPPSSDNGGSSSKRSSSRAPSPPPAPTRSPIIGSTSAATAVELAGDLLVLQRHDQPGVEVEVGIGWMSQDGQRIIVIGFVRDGDLGQTYAVVRREGDGQVVRRWIAPDSHLVYAVPWAVVNTQYTFPVGVILAIPLDDQYPPPNMLTRRFDGGDDRILAYDAELGQWRHVPDLATFQARGYYWCNVTAADAGFFERITLGPPYPTSNVPARSDYPVCQT